MRSEGSPLLLESRRLLAMDRIRDGYTPDEVADFLGVHLSSVYRWVGTLAHEGEPGLIAAMVPGRPPKLTDTQVRRVLAWVKEKTPEAFGFPTGHWTARRVASLIEDRFGVRFNHRYFNDWLSRHGISPQLPQRIPRERDEAVIRRWVTHDWSCIKRGRGPRARRSFLPTKAGC